MTQDITRPIVGIENRTAQEVFDIMVERFRRTPALQTHVVGEPVAWLYTSKSSGGSIVDWKPIDQMALRRDDWTWEPLYRAAPAKESGNAD